MEAMRCVAMKKQFPIISFEHASFQYEGQSQESLKDVKLIIKSGEFLVITGQSGCGKTTLLNLIPRFYDVTSGSITIDGIDVREMSQEKLRSLIGYVPQKGVLFSGTIASNLKFAGDQVSDEMMKEAADIAQAVDFIEEKEEKYNFNKKSAVETYEKLLNLIVRAPDREYFEKEMLKNYYNQVALAVDYAKKVFGPEFPPY